MWKLNHKEMKWFSQDYTPKKEMKQLLSSQSLSPNNFKCVLLSHVDIYTSTPALVSSVHWQLSQAFLPKVSTVGHS